MPPLPDGATPIPGTGWYGRVALGLPEPKRPTTVEGWVALGQLLRETLLAKNGYLLEDAGPDEWDGLRRR